MKNAPIIVQALEEQSFKTLKLWKQSLWIIGGGVILCLGIFWNSQQPELTSFALGVSMVLITAGNILFLINRKWTSQNARTLVIESNTIQSLSEKGENCEWVAAKLSFKGKSKFIGNNQLAKKSPKSFFLLDSGDWKSVQD